MPRRRIEGIPIARADDLWRKVGEPGPGAHYRGYLRFSHEAGHYGLTIESQRKHILSFAEAREWICDGWDTEPATTAKYEEIERRPAFRRHLEALERHESAISLCYMADRWARNKIVAYSSLSRLRRAGIWWATSDGRWTIDRTEEDGWDVAFAVEVSLNAGYSRRLSEKFRDAKNTRAHLGFHNGDLMFGYLRPPDPPRPAGAPFTWKPPRQAPIRHPEDFARLMQIGEWAAGGLTDRQIADRCNVNGWRMDAQKVAGPRLHYTGDDEDGQPQLAHDHIHGPRPFSKDTVRAMLIRAFPREYAPGSGRGTVIAPDGARIEGRHPAAWSWDLWHRIDEQRALRGRGGSRGQVAPAIGDAREQDAPPAHRPYRVWPFSGIIVCADCGCRLRAQAEKRGLRPGYRDTARMRGLECTNGGSRAIRAELLDEQFAALLTRPLPQNWREQIAKLATSLDQSVNWDSVEDRRRALQAERERLKTQHRYGLVTDEELLREAERIRQALEALPLPETQQTEAAGLVKAGETIASLQGYWEQAAPDERAELVRLLLLPEGLRYDLLRKEIVGLRARPLFAPVMALALKEWHVQNDGWLIKCDQPATHDSERREITL